jgi:DNA-binding ferritin-like protein
MKNKTSRAKLVKPKQYTRKNQTSQQKTHVNTHTSSQASPDILQNTNLVMNFIGMLNTVKLYHWKTTSYAQHKATDELYAKLNETMDTFIETLLGKTQSRIQSFVEKIDLVNPDTEIHFKETIFEFRAFLIAMTGQLHPKKDTDLLNIRDEILGAINQFLYLMTFQ